MVKTGHSYVKAAVAETKALAGFERSGHWFFNEPFGCGYDDAVLSAVHLLRMLDDTGSPLSELMKQLPQTWQSPTLGVFCPDNVKYDLVTEITEQYRQDQSKGTRIGGAAIKELVTVNGVRFVLDDNSWGLVRASSNKPSLVLVAESCTSEDQLYQIMEHLQKRLAATGQVVRLRSANAPAVGSLTNLKPHHALDGGVGLHVAARHDVFVEERRRAFVGVVRHQQPHARRRPPNSARVASRRKALARRCPRPIAATPR